MLENIIALLGEAPAIIDDAEAAYKGLKAFLASPAGQDVEAKFKLLFHATSTPGAAVVVEPKAAVSN